MKPKLCSGLVVLCIAVLSVTAAHADEPPPGSSQEAAERQASTDYGSSRVPVHWKKRFTLEVERYQRDWGIVTAVMLSAVGGVTGTVGLVAAGSRDVEVGTFVALPHLSALGFLAHFLNTANLTLSAIKGVVASSPSAEVVLRRMHRARIGTGVAALVVAGLGTALVPIAFAPDAYDAWILILPIVSGFAVAALTLLSISSAHLALAVEFERLTAGGGLRSARKAPAVRVVVTPTGIVGWF